MSEDYMRETIKDNSFGKLNPKSGCMGCCPDPGVFMKGMMFLQLQAVGLLDGGGSYPKSPGGLLRPVRLPREVLWAKGHAFRA